MKIVTVFRWMCFTLISFACNVNNVLVVIKTTSWSLSKNVQMNEIIDLVDYFKWKRKPFKFSLSESIIRNWIFCVPNFGFQYSKTNSYTTFYMLLAILKIHKFTMVVSNCAKIASKFVLMQSFFCRKLNKLNNCNHAKKENNKSVRVKTSKQSINIDVHERKYYAYFHRIAKTITTFQNELQHFMCKFIFMYILYQYIFWILYMMKIRKDSLNITSTILLQFYWIVCWYSPF